MAVARDKIVRYAREVLGQPRWEIVSKLKRYYTSDPERFITILTTEFPEEEYFKILEIITRSRGTFGGFQREKTVGEFIRDYLLEHGEAYIQEIHRAYKAWCRERGYRQPTYHSFAKYIWQLKSLGLLVPTRKEPSEYHYPRQYYRIADGADLEHVGWRDYMKVKGFRKKKKSGGS